MVVREADTFLTFCENDECVKHFHKSIVVLNPSGIIISRVRGHRGMQKGIYIYTCSTVV